MCHVLDIDRSGTRDELIDRVVEFLLQPQSSGKDYKGKEAEVRSKTQKRKSSSKKDNGEKGPRAISGYMMFMKVNREKVKAKHPEAGFGELGKLVAKKWNKLSDKEKEEWTEKGRKESANAKPKSSPKAKKRKKDASSSDGEGDDSSSESEEVELSDKIKLKIQEILKGDVESLSVKKIKEQLRADFADEVENKGDEIKAFVRECLKESS